MIDDKVYHTILIKFYVIYKKNAYAFTKTQSIYILLTFYNYS
jgi:hypothetical protein